MKKNFTLTRSGFDLLCLLATKGAARYTQQELADRLNAAIGTVNKLLKNFIAEKLIHQSPEKTLSITTAGKDVLRPYRVKHAIILAAGFSERLAPITLKTPKPLVEIRGKRIIDTIIDALLKAEVNDITVVVGYKAEFFKALTKKYPTVKLVTNDLYNQSGNITSLAKAEKAIDSTYICDADLFVHNPEIFSPYEYESCLFGVPVRETDDWCFTMHGNKIGRFIRGGDRCFLNIGVAYLNKKDSALFQTDMELLLQTRGGKEHWWFDVLFANKGHFALSAKSCYPTDLSEIDTVNDLVKIDPTYLGKEY